MPVKNKKATSPKELPKDPVKKFVVEEKLNEADKDVSPEIKPAEATEPPVTEQKEENIQNIAAETPDEKPTVSSELKSDTEKDTLPSTNLTSFSLLDSDKKEPEEKTDMQENIKETSQNESVIPSTSGDIPLKSSQDEVNKWIENYDEKGGAEKKKGSGFFKTFLIILTVLSLAAVIAGGVYYYQKNIAGGNKEEQKEEVGEKQEVQQPTATPTEEPVKETVKVDYSKYTLQVLNGSGIPGEAGKAKDLLKSLKFKSVLTGNASSYDFEKTTISLKENVPNQVFTEIKDLLSDTYDLESKAATSEDSSKYDVVVTVGQRK